VSNSKGQLPSASSSVLTTSITAYDALGRVTQSQQATALLVGICTSDSSAETMNAKDLETLKSNIDNLVKISCYDGESLVVKLLLVSEEDQDVVYDLVSTSRVHQYEKFDKQPAYRIRFQEIESVEALRHFPPKMGRAIPEE